MVSKQGTSRGTILRLFVDNKFHLQKQLHQTLSESHSNRLIFLNLIRGEPHNFYRIIMTSDEYNFKSYCDVNNCNFRY